MSRNRVLLHLTSTSTCPCQRARRIKEQLVHAAGLIETAASRDVLEVASSSTEAIAGSNEQELQPYIVFELAAVPLADFATMSATVAENLRSAADAFVQAASRIESLAMEG